MKPTYSYKPLLIDAKTAHEKGIITYDIHGDLTIHQIPELAIKKDILVSPEHQFPLVFATFTDLNKSLSRLANSPILKDGTSVREQFDKEFAKYRTLLEETQVAGKWEPDYGTYVYDQYAGNIYLIAPEYWHRLGLVTNTAKLFTSPDDSLSWQEIRNIFDNAVVGIVGVSVGGNILEGVMREIRPKHAKITDLDWEEITNLNRLERGSIRHLAGSRGRRNDPQNAYELNRINKAELAAYEHNLVDPYAEFYVYSEGLNINNMRNFLLGENGEPGVDVLIEEADNFPLKYEIRKLCRELHIPVLMISDFGHRVHVQFQDFKKNPNLPLGYKMTDEEVEKRLNKAMTTGNRDDVFEYVRALCGEDFAKDEFEKWVKAEGEQPTSSLPQSGGTALAGAGIGGKTVAWYLLGYDIPERFIYDFKNRSVTD